VILSNDEGGTRNAVVIVHLMNANVKFSPMIVNFSAKLRARCLQARFPFQ